MAVPSSLVIFLSCINVTLSNFWARIKIVVVAVATYRRDAENGCDEEIKRGKFNLAIENNLCIRIFSRKTIGEINWFP